MEQNGKWGGKAKKVAIAWLIAFAVLASFVITVQFFNEAYQKHKAEQQAQIRAQQTKEHYSWLINSACEGKEHAWPCKGLLEKTKPTEN